MSGNKAEEKTKKGFQDEVSCAESAGHESYPAEEKGGLSREGNTGAKQGVTGIATPYKQFGPVQTFAGGDQKNQDEEAHRDQTMEVFRAQFIHILVVAHY